MIKYQLKILLRHIKSKLFTSIVKVSGICLGFVTIILVVAFVKHEASYDKSITDYNRVYRVIRNWQESKDYGIFTPSAFFKELKEKFPQVETGTRYWPIGAECIISNDQVFVSQNIAAVDSSFIETFDLNFISGSRNNALSKPQSVIISRKFCKKVFPDGNAVGKTLFIEGSVYQKGRNHFTVTGVYEDFPGTCHLRSEVLMSINSFFIANRVEHTNHCLLTYVKLKNATDKSILENQFPDFMYNFYGKEYYEYARSTYKLQPIANIHLDPLVDYYSYESPKGSYLNLYIFPVLGLLIFLIITINYITLTIADNKRRKVSMGINKITGAGKLYFIKYFFLESLLFNSTGALVAIAMVSYLISPFELLVERNLAFDFFLTPINISLGIAFIVLISFFNSVFPAIKFSAVSAVQNLLKNGPDAKISRSFQPVFQVLQLAICILLLAGSMIVYKQLFYINEQLGASIDKEGVMIVRVPEQLKNNSESFKQELLKNPEIKSISICSNTPGNPNYAHYGFPVDPAAERLHVMEYICDPDYTKTLGLEIVEGRFFNPEIKTDINSIVLNETAVRKLGWENDPLGKKYSLGRTLHVIGVVKDFCFYDLHSSIGMLGIKMQPPNTGYLMTIKLNTDNLPLTINKIESSWNDFVHNREMQYSFLDNELAFWYNSERKTGTFALILSIMAIILSSIGLMAIILNKVQNQVKEIGVRKVNGAKATEILLLLNKNFATMVIVAFILSAPVSYIIMEKWLQNFAYSTKLNWWVFILAGSITFFITIATICFQSIKTARMNPVEALRYE